MSNGLDPEPVLIWVKTVYKGYHQTTKVAASKERVKNYLKNFSVLGQTKKLLSVFQITGQKILGRVGTHFFSGKKIYNFMHFQNSRFCK